MVALGDVKIAIVGDARQFSRTLAGVRGEVDKTQGRLSGLSGKAKAAFAVGAGAAVAFGTAAVNAGSNLNETLSKSNTVFGDQAKSIEDWAGTASTSFGQSKQQALEAASSFGNMFSQLGVGDKQAADMSKSMTELASDFASFHNADITEVLTAQQAAFRGEYDALQRFVPTINAAAVEQKALAMTGKRTTDELTAQEKALATQTLMMEGAGDAAGDFERTSDGLANKQRTLSAQFGDLQAKIGQALIPVVEKVVGVFSSMATWVEENQGKAQVLAGVVGGILVAAFVAWGVSVIAATWPIILIGAAVAALVAGVIYAYTHWDWFRDAVDAVARFLTQTLWPALQKVWAFIKDNLIPIVAEIIQKYVDFYSKVAEVVADVIDVFGGLVEWFAGLPGAIGWIFEGLADIIKAPFETAFEAIKWLWNNTVGGFKIEVPDWVPFGMGGKSFEIPEMARGGIVTGPTIALIGEAGPEAVIPLSRMGGTGRMANLSAMNAGGGTTSTTVNITVNGGDPQRVVEAVSKYIKSNGQPTWLRA